MLGRIVAMKLKFLNRVKSIIKVFSTRFDELEKKLKAYQLLIKVKLKQERKYQVVAILLFCVFLTLIIIALVTISQPTKPNTEIFNNKNTVTYSVTEPSEEPVETPEKKYEWPGLESDPKYITLPTINTSGYVINVGIDQDNAIAVPPNVHLAGWFVNSVLPGQKGLSIIDGHVDGTNIGGIFRNLKEIKIGDSFTVAMGNESNLEYKVKDVQIIANEDAANILFSQIPNVESQLNLITCGGNYLTDQQTYDKRVIVMAELVN